MHEAPKMCLIITRTKKKQTLPQEILGLAQTLLMSVRFAKKEKANKKKFVRNNFFARILVYFFFMDRRKPRDTHGYQEI